MNPTIRKPAESRTIAVVGDVYRFLATGEDTSGKYALFEAIVLPGGGPPPHVHSREEEGFYILEGEITFTVGDQRLIASAGMFANMPVGTPHSFKNESGKPARMLISVAPAGLEQMFFEVGVPMPSGATTAAPPTHRRNGGVAQGQVHVRLPTACQLVCPRRSVRWFGSSLGLAGGSQGRVESRWAFGLLAVDTDSGPPCRCGLLVLMAEDGRRLRPQFRNDVLWYFQHALAT